MNELKCFYHEASMESQIEFSMCLLAQMSIRELIDKKGLDLTTAIADFMESTTAVCLFDKETGLWENGPDYIVNEYEREKALAVV